MLRSPITDNGVIDLTEAGDVAGLLLQVLATAGNEKIEYICQTSGGWEGWLQCELAYLVKSGNREANIYGDRRRTDLIWYQEGAARPLSIELKAAGLGRNPDEFFNECAADLRKLRATSHEYKPVAAVLVPNWDDFAGLHGALTGRGYTRYPAGVCTLYAME